MRNRNEFVQLIDRYRLGQAQRLSIGLSLKPDFSAIQASLVLTEGRGKFLRTRWIENREFPLADSIARPCHEAIRQSDTGVREFTQLRVDLTQALALATNQMATLSANHARMLMDVCVWEPGLWLRDYDGKTAFQTFCEPSWLAEQTGLTTIDALPNRDLAAGGRGWPLAPLVLWLIFADRDKTVAENPRLVVKTGPVTELVWLPESDGLDNELPAIRYQRFPGEDFLNGLLTACDPAGPDSWRPAEAASDGSLNPQLVRLWDEFVAKSELDRVAADPAATDRLIEKSVALVRQTQASVGDVLKTFATHLAIGTRRFLDRQSSHRGAQLVAAGEFRPGGMLLNEIGRAVDRPWLDTTAINYDPRFVDSNVAAIAGLLHLDQMPLTVPWLTGSRLPRVLGRLTPGSPANWRRVVMEMGDCHPPVMKLRDAV